MPVLPQNVHSVLRRTILAEGYPFVFDPAGSHGQYLRDAITGDAYLDFFSFYASRSVRYDHPAFHDPAYVASLMLAARIKPSNGDVYTTTLADFVDTFRRDVMGDQFQHLFIVDGGALAVENGLKAAFDWKAQKNAARGLPEGQLAVVHFEHAFHGRSGYTLSLTNTDDTRKIAAFPKFHWPRIPSPAVDFSEGAAREAKVVAQEQAALATIDKVYRELGEENIACVIIEPVQSEGGDRHIRPAFLQALRQICDDRETLLIFDEVQTGMGTSGAWWAAERLGVVPDIIAFAKRAQVGGVIAGRRLDEVQSVFHVKSRISSTFMGNLVDMVRSQRTIGVVKEEGLLENARERGLELLARIQAFSGRFQAVTNPRGLGLLLAFDLPDRTIRERLLARCFEEKLLLLTCGPRSIRMRPALDVSSDDIDEAMARLEMAAKHVL
jgi:L-lysine 6-transaminase